MKEKGCDSCLKRRKVPQGLLQPVVLVERPVRTVKVHLLGNHRSTGHVWGEGNNWDRI